MYSNDLVCEIIKYIDENLLEKLTIEHLVTKFNYNRFYIMKRFKKELGVSIINYVNYQRIYNSILEIIDNKDISFIKVALNNGFISLEYFSETFKNIMKVSPQIFKSSLKRNNNLQIEEILIIHERIVFLKMFFDKKNNYLKMQKPKEYPVKKLTIFK